MSETKLEAIHRVANQYHLIDAGNEAFYAAIEKTSGAEAVKCFKDNVALDYYGCYVEQENNYAIDPILLVTVYEAAQEVFRHHEGQKLIYDLPSAADEFGSPYAARCATPEEWVIVFARRMLEDDAGELGEWDSAKVYRAVELVRDLHAATIPPEKILLGLDTLCHDDEGFTAAVRQALVEAKVFG